MNCDRWLLCSFVNFVLYCCSSATFGQVQFLEQNWDDATRKSFYTTSQGSRLLPYDWFMALEVSGGESSFVATRLPQLGYLANKTSGLNPDGLPVGFVVDVDWSGSRHLGLNCAACHTNQLRFRDTTYQIDGGPAQADIWGLLSGIGDSLIATDSNPEKWSRFSAKVVQGEANTVTADSLKIEYKKFLKYYSDFITSSKTQHPWGRARLDAFGMIFNRVSSIDLDPTQNSEAPDAPVSYPFLWGTSWEDKVQWNGSAPNSNDIERLGRNLGEVLGVFAQADLERASIFKPYFRTSARRLNQLRLENKLKRLWSPAWPKEIVPIDPVKQAAGQLLFQQNCVRCHEIIPHGKQDHYVDVHMTPLSEVLTDAKMAENAANRKAKTGRLEGSRIGTMPPLPANVSTAVLLEHVVVGAVLSPFPDVQLNNFKHHSLEDLLGILNRIQEQRITDKDIADFLHELNLSQDQVMELIARYQTKLTKRIVDLQEMSRTTGEPSAEVRDRILAYKARPLDGIWATGPYLHNGSIPNLYELVSPVAERSTTFHVGSIEFDDAKVGYKTVAGEGTSLFDTALPGNSNHGHDTYGDFSPAQRWALVEYMKSL